MTIIGTVQRARPEGTWKFGWRWYGRKGLEVTVRASFAADMSVVHEVRNEDEATTAIVVGDLPEGVTGTQRPNNFTITSRNDQQPVVTFRLTRAAAQELHRAVGLALEWDGQ